ncbi:hypothetical protein L1887_18854 [Cichorium endivia]|nr:hypothetical protein L1887_18854 [Cichorium endivia]
MFRYRLGNRRSLMHRFFKETYKSFQGVFVADKKMVELNKAVVLIFLAMMDIACCLLGFLLLHQGCMHGAQWK